MMICDGAVPPVVGAVYPVAGVVVVADTPVPVPLVEAPPVAPVVPAARFVEEETKRLQRDPRSRCRRFRVGRELR